MNRDPKLEKFRQKYQSEMSPFYNPWIHMGLMWGAALLLIFWTVGSIEDGGWFWLALVPVFLGLNFFEWWVHKYVMHRRIDLPGFRGLYERHTGDHHRYFTQNHMAFDRWKEMRVIAFPWQAMLGFVVGGTIAGAVAAGIAKVAGFHNPEALGLIIFMGFTVYYLLFDVMHVSTHFEDNIFLRNMPFVNTLRRLHAAHHNPESMRKGNFNLTFPVADYIMGTSDLQRGFWGTIFNGYSEDYVRSNDDNKSKVLNSV